jgi:hypothetical protein
MVTVQSCLACHWLGDTGLDSESRSVWVAQVLVTRPRTLNSEALLNAPHSPE